MNGEYEFNVGDDLDVDLLARDGRRWLKNMDPVVLEGVVDCPRALELDDDQLILHCGQPSSGTYAA